MNAADQCPGTPGGVTVDERGCPLDSDGDGVANYLDQCPDTSPGIDVDTTGCPVDSDQDGVADDRDRCPHTPAGAEVNANGCWALSGVTFAVGKWDIDPDAYEALDAVVSILNGNPDLHLEIQGHTDNMGDADKNQALSEKRARSVMLYLIGQGIDQERLTFAGFGESRPIAPNRTAEGRSANRRVELTPIHE